MFPYFFSCFQLFLTIRINLSVAHSLNNIDKYQTISLRSFIAVYCGIIFIRGINVRVGTQNLPGLRRRNFVCSKFGMILINILKINAGIYIPGMLIRGQGLPKKTTYIGPTMLKYDLGNKHIYNCRIINAKHILKYNYIKIKVNHKT